MSQLPTVEDVARLASVSRQTVSNVLNSPEIVRGDTRTRVETAIAQLGYRPHASARRLRTQQSSTIGVRLDPLLDGISGSVLDRYLHALTEQATKRGMRIMLFTASDPYQEIEELRGLRAAADVDAFVITATRFEDPRIDWLIRERIPFVTFGRPWGEDMDSPDRLWVDVDGFSGTHEATEHLFGRGLSRIGYLGWPAGSGTGDERHRGWTAAMREHGADDAHLAQLERVSEESVSSARRLVERLIVDDPALEAIVCVSDSLALGALMAVNEAGRNSFPVIGFDNTPVAQAVGLSSVEQRLDVVAAGTLELLMGVTGSRVIPLGSSTEHYRLVTPKLVVRRSSHLAPVEEGAGRTTTGDHNREETK